ncbi:hypothetical protein PESHB5_09070 [Pediococcus parvulus]|nr:hypothetical protein [Pediococcus parvulus]
MDFVLDGILTTEEANWVPTQGYITYAEGNYFDRSHLPVSA